MIDGRERLRKLVLNASRWSGAAAIAAPRLAGVGAILMLHSVTANPRQRLGLNDHLSITPNFLDIAIGEMKRAGYAFVSMDEVVEHLAARGRSRVATITADDGYLDNFTEALPVFENHDTPFAIYVAPGLIEGEIQPWWEVCEELAFQRSSIAIPNGDRVETLNASTLVMKRKAALRLYDLLSHGVEEDQRQALLETMQSRDLETSAFMNWNQIKQIDRHPLGTIGGHTMHHYNLARLDREKALDEMIRSADLLQERLGVRPAHFAYPYGHEQAAGLRETRLAAEAGFVSAVTTRHGTLQPEHIGHIHALPRISLNGRYQNVAYLRTMLTGVTSFANTRRRVVTL